VFHCAAYVFTSPQHPNFPPQRRANKKKQSAKLITAAQDAAVDSAYIDEVEAFLAEGEDQPAKVGESRKRGPDEVSLIYSICAPLCFSSFYSQMVVDDEGGPAPAVSSNSGNTLDESVNQMKESLVCQHCTPASHNYTSCSPQNRPRAEVRYMPLFNIKGVDTKSRAYLKSVNTQPEIVHTVPSFKRARTSLAQQHDLIGGEASGKTYSWF